VIKLRRRRRRRRRRIWRRHRGKMRNAHKSLV
jgi:hypothetical protein